MRNAWGHIADVTGNVTRDTDIGGRSPCAG